MRVIYTPKDEKEIECPNCGNILGYNEYDIYSGYNELFGEFYDYEYLRCPVCKEKIFLWRFELMIAVPLLRAISG